jgi:hypothetical protein
MKWRAPVVGLNHCIHTMLKENTRDFRASLGRRPMQWGPPMVVLGICVCVMFEKKA